jgi:hypothetical protein
MATKYKSVLEKYPPYGSEAWKQLKEKEQAIEPDTTLEGLLIAPARAGYTALKSATRRPTTRTTEAPEIGSGIAPDSVWKNVGWGTSQAERQEAKKQAERATNSYMMNRALEDSAERATRNLYGEVGARSAVDRNQRDEQSKVKQLRLEQRIEEENNKPMLKRGGKVTASSRADGAAQRGKTRGRVV